MVSGWDLGADGISRWAAAGWHYEPLESPVRNAMYLAVQNNPVSENKRRERNRLHASSPDPEVSVHLDDVSSNGASHGGRDVSRTLSHLAELQPEMFAESSTELAQELSIVPGEWITVSTARGAIEAHALVTPRMQTLMIDGKPMQQVGAAISLGIFGDW